MHPRLPLLAVLAAALLLSGCAAGGSESEGHDGHAMAEEAIDTVVGGDAVVVTAVDIDFQPETLELRAGEPLNVTVVNEGDVLHDFTLDAAGVHLDVEPGEEAVAGVTIDEPGTYEAYCTVAGHAEAGMTVAVVVT